MDVSHVKACPVNGDWISVGRTPSGAYELTGVVAFDKSAIFNATNFPTKDEAEAAGLAWAEQQGAEHLFVVIDDA